MAIQVKTRAQYEARARIAKALAHPTRLLLLDALQNQELCVCDLTEVAGVDQSTVSRHLSILRSAGLVVSRKEHAKAMYRRTACCFDRFLSCLETVLEHNLEAQRSLV